MSYYVTMPRLRAPRRGAVALGAVLPESAPAPVVVDIPDAEWKRRMLAAQEGFVVEAQRFRDQDKKARIAQISATLAIPLAAAIWRWILNRRSIPTGTE